MSGHALTSPCQSPGPSSLFGSGEFAKTGRIAGKRFAEQKSVVVERQRGVQHLTGSLVPTSKTGVSEYAC